VAASVTTMADPAATRRGFG